MEKINTIVEGCFPDTPGKLAYAGLEMQIPENAHVLKSDKRTFLLYGDSNNRDLRVINNPFFETYGQVKVVRGGFPLERLHPNFSWIFDAQRSLTTRDGRIYIETVYFHKDWRWYLEAVPKILEVCGKLFSGELTEADVNKGL